MTTGREVARGEKRARGGAMITSHERAGVKASGRVKGGIGALAMPSALRSSASKKPSSLKERMMNRTTEVYENAPTIDELLKTVKRLEKGFLSLADAVIAEIEGMKDNAQCWQEEREELWKTMMAFHKRGNAELEPIHCRLDSLEKRACDIEKHLQSGDPDTQAPANNRLDELERRAYELEKQVKKQQIHVLQGPQSARDIPAFKDELAHRSALLELQGQRLEGSKRGAHYRYSDPEEAIHAVHKEIEELRTTSRHGELQQTELQYNVSAITHDLHKLQVWCKLFENDQAMFARFEALLRNDLSYGSWSDLEYRKILQWRKVFKRAKITAFAALQLDLPAHF